MASVKMCEIEGCCNHVRAKGLCAMHYARVQKHGDPNGGRAGKPFKGKLRPLICEVPDCERPHVCRGLCATHYQRLRDGRDLGLEITPRNHGEKYLDQNGYVCFTERGHPEANTKNGRVHEHRAVMAKKLGRKLLPGENVHHKNGDRSDNHPDNLELWVSTQPSGQRPEDLVKWAREILALYGPLVEESCLERRLNDRSYERAIPPLKLLS